MTRLNRKLIALLTTIALIALPATDAFAGRNWQTTDHHIRNHHALAHHYVTYGRSWT